MRPPTPFYSDASITIYHGDALDILPFLLDVDGVVTDPPYSSGGAFRGDRMATALSKYSASDSSAQERDGLGFTGDNRDQRSFLAWCALWMLAARRATVDGGSIATFIDWRQLPTITDALQCGGWVWRGVGAWSKKFGRPREGGFSSACEFLPWGTNGEMVPNGQYPAGVFEESPRRIADRVHLTEKPIALCKWAMGNVKPGGLVLDPFMGSGSTLLAAILTGRRAIGIDVDEAHCETAARGVAGGLRR